MKKLAISLVLSLAFVGQALAQSCPGGSTCNPLESYSYSAPSASTPLVSSLKVAIVPSTTASSLQSTPATTWAQAGNNLSDLGSLSAGLNNLTGAALSGSGTSCIHANAAGVLSRSSGDCATGGSGSVTSVALTAPAIFGVGGSPITTSGTLSLSLNTQSANTVFSGPASGGPVVPTFRSLVNLDLPVSGVSAGTYTNPSITVNAQGIVTNASSGSGGSVTSTGSTTNNTIPTWTSTTNQLQGAGLTYGTTPTSGLVQTSGGFISASVIPGTGTSTGNFSQPRINVGLDGRLTSASTGVTYYVGNLTGGTGSPNAYTFVPTAAIAPDLPSACFDGLTVQAHIATSASANTGASTLAVGSCTANITRQNDLTGNIVLTGGEIVKPSGAAGHQMYQFTYSSITSTFINTVFPSGALTIITTGGSFTVAQSQWANNEYFIVNAPGITITLQQVGTYGTQGGILVNSPNYPVSLAVNGADTILGNTSPGAGTQFQGLSTVNADGGSPNGNVYVNFPGHRDIIQSWGVGYNLSTAPIPVYMNRGRPATVNGIICLVTAVVGGTATFDIYDVPDGTAITTGGIKVTTTACNANSLNSNAAQNLLSAPYSLAANRNIGIVATGGGWPGTGAGTLELDLLK